MIILNDFFQNRIEEPTAFTIGKFDGLHRGHELLFEDVLAQKECLPCILTFKISPRVAILKEEDRNLITAEERRKELERKGLEYLLEIPASEEFFALEPEEFIHILYDNFHMRYLACGTDFSFGKKGLGNVELLRKLSKELGFRLCVEEKLTDHEKEISSTLIREEIKEGHILRVNELLGYPYFIWGRIVYGNHIGTGMGVPTINQLPPEEKLLPPNGVYVTEVEIHGKIYHGISNVGVKPTVQNQGPIGVETYILDFKENVYEECARVIFLEYVREERKFDSLDALKEQIRKDTDFAFRFFNHRASEGNSNP